jgi:hypothetical protein
LSLQAQLLGRSYKRSIQAAEGGTTAAGDGQVQGIGRSQGRGPAAQAGVGIAEVLRLQFQHQQAWRQAALKTLQHRLALVRTFRPRAEWSSVILQELIASGALASARNAVAVAECTSGVSTASSTQVSM